MASVAKEKVAALLRLLPIILRSDGLPSRVQHVLHALIKAKDKGLCDILEKTLYDGTRDIEELVRLRVYV